MQSCLSRKERLELELRTSDSTLYLAFSLTHMQQLEKSSVCPQLNPSLFSSVSFINRSMVNITDQDETAIEKIHLTLADLVRGRTHMGAEG